MNMARCMSVCDNCNPLGKLGSAEEGIVSCQSMSCCSSIDMNSAVGARQFTLPIYSLASSHLQFLPITIYSGD